MFRLSTAASSDALARFQPTTVRRGKRLCLGWTPVNLTLDLLYALRNELQ